MEHDLVLVRVNSSRSGGVGEAGNAPVCSSVIGAEHVDSANPNGIRVGGVHFDVHVVPALPYFLGIRRWAGTTELRIVQQQRVEQDRIGIGGTRGPSPWITARGRAKHRAESTNVRARPV